MYSLDKYNVMWVNNHESGYWLYLNSDQSLLIRIFDMGFVISNILYDENQQNIKNIDISLSISLKDLDLDEYINDNTKMHDFVKEIIDMQGKGVSDDELVELYAGMNQIYKNDALKMLWAITRKKNMESGIYDNDVDFLKYHLI